MIVMAFVLIWLLVLIPLALRRHSEHHLASSVARFRHQRKLLERAYANHANNRDPQQTNVVGRIGEQRVQTRRALDERVSIRQRRRLSLGVLATAFSLTLMIGFVPALRVFFAVAIVLAVLLVTYLVLLARCVASEAGGAHSRTAVGVPDRAPALWEDRPALPTSRTSAEGAVAYLSPVRLVLEERSA